MQSFTGGTIEKFHVERFTLFLVAAAVLSALNYGQFLLNPANVGTPFLYVILVVSEIYVIIHLIISWITILAGSKDVRDIHYFDIKKKLKLGQLKATIDVFITVYGEPLEIIKETIVAAKALTLNHETYVLDDGKSDEVKRLAATLGVNYIRRDINLNAKAGNINHALSITKGEYFAIFDADFVPKKDFLLKTIPFFNDEQVSFVQTPQFYRNTDNMISKGAALAQNIFYKLICPGKNSFGAVFCVGTNVVFRKEPLMKTLNGIYDKSNSEDIWTAYMLHQSGYKSVFLEEELATGLAPDNAPDYLKQQQRWATGAFEIFFKKNPLFAKLSFDQKFQYLDSVIHYFSGIVLLINIFMPVMYLYFGMLPINPAGGFQEWAIHYLPYLITQYLIITHIIGKNFISAVVVTVASYWVYIKAIKDAISKKKKKWVTTGSKKKEVRIGDYLVYHYVTVAILVSAIIVGVFNIKDTTLTIGYILWALLYIVIFAIFIQTSLKLQHK